MAGNKLFGVDIAKIVNKEIAPGLLDATLTKSTYGSRTSGDLTSGQSETSKSYPCKGIVSRYSDEEINGTTILKSDRKILLIGNSIDKGNVVPEPGDQIFIESSTYEIQEDGVNRDPAKATYSCHSR